MLKNHSVGGEVRSRNAPRIRDSRSFQMQIGEIIVPCLGCFPFACSNLSSRSNLFLDLFHQYTMAEIVPNGAPSAGEDIEMKEEVALEVRPFLFTL